MSWRWLSRDPLRRARPHISTLTRRPHLSITKHITHNEADSKIKKWRRQGPVRSPTPLHSTIRKLNGILTWPCTSYPKHVWSPAGGWYAQPANWRTNTAIMSAIVFGVVAMTWKLSADREHRDKMPEVCFTLYPCIGLNLASLRTMDCNMLTSFVA